MMQSLNIAMPHMGIDVARSSSSSMYTSPSSSIHELHRSASPTPTDVSEVSTSYADIPLTALSKATRRQLSQLLNTRKILRSEEGYERDWRGLALFSEQKNYCDETAMSGNDPISKVLELWCINNPKTATFGNLERYLGFIDRWDVCDDIYENLVEDAKHYHAEAQIQSLTLRELSEVDGNGNSNSNSRNNNTNSATATDATTANFGLGSDANILTNDDVKRAQKGLPPQMYDAFVLFADADINYAVEMITKLEENPEYQFKLCIKDRDLLAGVSFAHVALTQLIEERCKHLIVILTEEFINSPENSFLVNYTQALQIQNNTRKIIPLLYDDNVVTPRTLKIYTHLRYNTSASSFVDFWSKLAASIRNVNISTDSPPLMFSKDKHSSSPIQRKADAQKSNIPKLPTPPIEIPSININGNAFEPEELTPTQKEQSKYKKSSSLNTSNAKQQLHQSLMRSAHSTSQLNNMYDYRDPMHSSLSNLSTTSTCSEPKKKKKWPSKLFRKVFSRSTNKLQETA